MIVREYQPEDLDALRAIHAAQGFAYPFPDLSEPLFISKLVLAEPGADLSLCSSERGGEEISLDSGPRHMRTSARDDAESSERILGAVFLRLTAEAYLLLDPQAGTPRDRWRRLLALHSTAERDAWRRGLEDVHAWLPPPIAAKFGRRLARLGWVRDDRWTPYCRKLYGDG